VYEASSLLQLADWPRISNADLEHSKITSLENKIEVLRELVAYGLIH
jgi:hypothetical protein